MVKCITYKNVMKKYYEVKAYSEENSEIYTLSYDGKNFYWCSQTKDYTHKNAALFSSRDEAKSILKEMKTDNLVKNVKSKDFTICSGIPKLHWWHGYYELS